MLIEDVELSLTSIQIQRSRCNLDLYSRAMLYRVSQLFRAYGVHTKLDLILLSLRLLDSNDTKNNINRNIRRRHRSELSPSSSLPTPPSLIQEMQFIMFLYRRCNTTKKIYFSILLMAYSSYSRFNSLPV